MILTETKYIKNKDIFRMIDGYSYRAKNLYNSCNYIIKQAYRISCKLSEHKPLEAWEQDLIDDLNRNIDCYNNGGRKIKTVKPISEENGYIVDAYFLSWYLRGTDEFKQMPMAICGQIVIQMLCKNWKAYFKAIKDFMKNSYKYLGMPKPPKYLDKESGRQYIILTNQNFKRTENSLILPKAFDGIKINTDKEIIQQIRFKPKRDKVIVEIIYKVPDVPVKEENGRCMGIDLGVNNLATVTFNTDNTPLIINGKPLKSINQYYNKKLAYVTSVSLDNRKSKAVLKVADKRNDKVKDYLHKASKKVIQMAIDNDISKIVIGNNKKWKQEVNIGRINNQTFVYIPFYTFINMVSYKAALVGITVEVVEESYTSGTSYIDNEQPIRDNYKKSRRKKRGLFVSNSGIPINADVNGSYQIMKKADVNVIYKGFEKVTRLQVA